MRPKAKADIRPQPKPGVSIRPQQVMAMLGVLLMFAMALAWLWQPLERNAPSGPVDTVRDSLQQEVVAPQDTAVISRQLTTIMPR